MTRPPPYYILFDKIQVYLFSKLSFALAFFMLRWILWFPNAYGMHSDSYHYMQSGNVHSRMTVVAVVLGNIFISGLQVSLKYFIYRYILCESCSRFDLPPLIYYHLKHYSRR